MFKYNDIFNDMTNKTTAEVKKFIGMMYTAKSHIISIKLGKVTIAVSSEYYPIKEEDNYISSFNVALSRYFMKNLGWDDVRINAFSNTQYVYITLIMVDDITGPLDKYEISCPDHDLCSFVLVAKRLKANKWFPELCNSEMPSKTYDYIIKDLEAHLTRLDDNHVTLTAMNGFGAICANALYAAYKKEFPFVSVGKDEFDNCEITLVSRSFEKARRGTIDGVSSHEFTLPYIMEENTVEKSISPMPVIY